MAHAYVTFISRVRMFVSTNEGDESYTEEEFKKTILDEPDYFEVELAENATIEKIENFESDDSEDEEDEDGRGDDHNPES